MVTRTKTKTATAKPLKAPVRQVKKASPKPRKAGALLGITVLQREGKKLIGKVCREDVELTFSTGKSPQFRMRPAYNHPEVVEKIPPKHRIRLSRLQARYSQYRAIMLFGAVLRVQTDDDYVVLDRDPSFIADVVDDHSRDLKEENPARTYAVTRKAAKAARAAEDASSQSLESLQGLAEESRLFRLTVTGLLESILERGTLTEVDRKLLSRLASEESYKARVAEKNKPNSGHLTSYEVD